MAQKNTLQILLVNDANMIGRTLENKNEDVKYMSF